MIVGRDPGTGEKLGGRNPKRSRDLQDVREAWVASPALDAADVGPVQLAFERETFLREAALFAQGADRLAEVGVCRRPDSHPASFPS